MGAHCFSYALLQYSTAHYVLRFGARLAGGGRGRRGGGGGGGGGSSGEGDGGSICGGCGAASAVLVATDEDSDVGVRPCGGE